MKKLTFILACLTVQFLYSQANEEAKFVFGILQEVSDSMMKAYEAQNWENTLIYFEKLNEINQASCKDYFIASECYTALSSLNVDSASILIFRRQAQLLYNKGVEYCGESLMSEIMTTDVFRLVEKNAEPSVGWESYYKDYIDISYNYSKRDSMYGIQGIAYLDVIINKDGTIGGCRVLKGVSEDLDNEAVKLVKEGPVWNAGYQNGQPVYFIKLIAIPFYFKNYWKRKNKENKEAKKLKHK